MKNGLLPRQNQEPFAPNRFYNRNLLQDETAVHHCTKEHATKQTGKRCCFVALDQTQSCGPASPNHNHQRIPSSLEWPHQNLPPSHQLDAPDLGQAHRKAHIEGSSSSQCEKRTLPCHRVHLPSLLTWKKRSSTQVLPQIQQQSKEAYFHILWYEFLTSTSHVCHLHLSKWKRNLFEVYFANRKRGKAGDGRRLSLMQTSANYASEITL